MKTIRDHLAGQSAVPAPPPGATHALVWEPYGDSRAGWALVDLDTSPGAAALFVDGPADLPARTLAGHASALLGGVGVSLSPRIEVDGEVGYYVTPGGGR